MFQIYCPHCNGEKPVTIRNNYDSFNTYTCSSDDNNHIIVDFAHEYYNKLYHAVVGYMTALLESLTYPTVINHSISYSIRVLDYMEKLLKKLAGTNHALKKEEFLLLTISACLHEAAVYESPGEPDRKISSHITSQACRDILREISETDDRLTQLVTDLDTPLDLMMRFLAADEEELKSITFHDTRNHLFTKLPGPRVKMFSAILRLADQLDITKERVEGFSLPENTHLPPQSSLIKLKHLIINSITISDNQEITIQFRRPQASEDERDFYRKIGIAVKAKLEYERYLLFEEKLNCIEPGCKSLINPTFPPIADTFYEHFEEQRNFELPSFLQDTDVRKKIQSAFNEEMDGLIEKSAKRIEQSVSGEESENPGQSKKLNRAKSECALLYYARGDNQKALEILSAINEETYDYIRNRITADISFDNGEYEKAESLYEEITKLNPRNCYVLRSLGTVYHKMHSYGKALDCYEKALKIKPDYPEVLNNMGACYRKLGQVDRSLECYEKALKIKPDYPEALNNMGIVYKELGQIEKAVNCYEKALKIKHGYYEVLHNLGIAYLDLNQFDKVIDCFEKALEVNPDNPDALQILALAYKSLNQYDKSLDCYEKALKTKLDNPEALYLLGIAYHNENKIDKAIDCLEKAIEIRKDFPEAWFNLGYVYHTLNKFDESISCYEKALEIKPDYPEALNNMGILYGKQGNHEKSTVCYKKALKINPNYQASLINLNAAAKNQIKKNLPNPGLKNLEQKLKTFFDTLFKSQ